MARSLAAAQAQLAGLPQLQVCCAGLGWAGLGWAGLCCAVLSSVFCKLRYRGAQLSLDFSYMVCVALPRYDT